MTGRAMGPVGIGLALAVLSVGGPQGCEEKQAPAVAAPVAAPPTVDAAAIYKRCWPAITRELAQAAADTRWTDQGVSAGGGSWEQARSRLRGAGGTVGDLVRASAAPACDFGLPTVKQNGAEEASRAGIELNGHLRDAARLLRADAARCFSEKDLDGATDRIAAMYGLCAQVSASSVVLVAMTDEALLGLANDAARLAAGGLNAEQKKRLLAAMDRLDGADPAGMGRARKAEGQLADEAMRARLDQGERMLGRDLARTRQALSGP